MEFSLTSILPLFVVFFILIMPTISAQEFEDRIPIGAMFDHSSMETTTAFKYEIMKNNGDQERIMLQSNEAMVNMTDAFDVISTVCNLMANGIFVLSGMHRAQTINVIRSYTQTFKMPFITPSMAINRTGQELGYELYMRPLYTQAILDIILYYQWTPIYYLYDTAEGLQRLYQLFDAIAADTHSVKVHPRHVTDVEHAYATIMDLYRTDTEKHVLLDIPTKACEEILLRQKMDTRRVKYHYLLVGLGLAEINLTDYTHGGIYVTGFRLVDLDISNTIKYLKERSILNPDSWVVGDENKISYEAALAVDAVRLIRLALQRMRQNDPKVFQHSLRNGRIYNNGTEGIDCDADPVLPWKHGYEIMETLRKMEFTGLSGKIAFDRFGLRSDYQLTVLEIKLNRGLAKIGYWNPSDGLSIESPAMVGGNGTIAKAKRVVTSILTAPYLMVRAPINGQEYEGNDKYEGYCAYLAKLIADRVQFDYHIQPVKDGRYGSEYDNGTWNGMMGELIRGEADLAIAPFTITSQRESIIDFSAPFMRHGISIMIKKPDREVPPVFSFLYPLSYGIWMCIICACMGVSVVLFLVSQFTLFERHIEQYKDGHTVTNNITILNCLWFSLGAFMQQGCESENEPRSVSGRIVSCAWWFFTLIIISSYTANLAAFLTVERMQLPIQSADDLAKQNKIKYGVMKYGSTENFFKKSKHPVYEKMWASMSSANPSVFVSSIEEGVGRVRDGKTRYAFLVESTTNYYFNHKKPCDTMKVGGELDASGYGIGTPLGSDLRDRINLAVLELREYTLLLKLENKWWYEKRECGVENMKKADITSSRRLDNVAGLSYILIGGLCLALFVALLEFLYTKMEDKFKKDDLHNIQWRSTGRASKPKERAFRKGSSAFNQFISDNKVLFREAKRSSLPELEKASDCNIAKEVQEDNQLSDQLLVDIKIKLSQLEDCGWQCNLLAGKTEQFFSHQSSGLSEVLVDDMQRDFITQICNKGCQNADRGSGESEQHLSDLLKKVQDKLNASYSRTVGSNQTVPYAALNDGTAHVIVEGWPQDVPIRSPHILSQNELQAILKAEITFRRRCEAHDIQPFENTSAPMASPDSIVEHFEIVDCSDSKEQKDVKKKGMVKTDSRRRILSCRSRTSIL